FSSRRRHTRFSRDWSSDVCSSDLPADRLQRHAGGPAAQPPHRDPRAALRNQRAPMRRILDILTSRWCVTLLAALVLALLVWFAESGRASCRDRVYGPGGRGSADRR